MTQVSAKTGENQRPTMLGIVRAVIEGLEAQEYLPGQRLVEADLCLRFGAGRQAVREALHQLQARGVVELTPNRGASIVRLTRKQSADTLEVTETLFALLARSAALRISEGSDPDAVVRAIATLENLPARVSLSAFADARRRFFNALAAVSANEELSHLMRHVRVHVLRAQFGHAGQHPQHGRELLAVGRCVLAGDGATAEALARDHVRGIRENLIEE